ncbi:MAG: hypothetical protein RSD85_00780 [Erysipelotrichaceae bacterium]
MMNNLNIFKLNLYSLKQDIKTKMKLIIQLSFILVTLMFLIYYIIFMSNSLTKYETSNASKNSINISYNMESELGKIKDIINDNRSLIDDYTIVEKIVPLVESNPTVIDNVNFRINGKDIKPKQKRNYHNYNGFSDEYVNFNCLLMMEVGVNENNLLELTNAEEKELSANNYNSAVFISGHNISNNNEVVMSSFIADTLGYNQEQYDSLLGSKIDITIRNSNFKILNAKLVGIFNEDINQIKVPKIYSELYISDNYKNDINLDETINNKEVIVYLKGFQSIIMLNNKMLEKGLQSSYDSSSFEILESFQLQAKMFSKLLFILGLLLIVGFVLYFILTYQQYEKTKKKYYLMLKYVGYSNNIIIRIKDMEIAIMLSIAYIVGMLFNIIIILIAEKNLLNLNISLNAATLCVSLGITLIIIIFLVAITHYRNSMIYKDK